jgi:hypothetical protein
MMQRQTDEIESASTQQQGSMIGRIAFRAFAGGVLLGTLLLVWGCVTSWYAAEPLTARFSLGSSDWFEFPFRVWATGDYYVRVRFRNALSDEEMNRLLGNIVTDGRDVVQVEWEVRAGDGLVAEGSSSEYGYSPFLSNEGRGLVIGRFRGNFGRSYILRLRSNNPSPELDRCDPGVAAALHPSSLEYLMWYSYVGVALLLATGPALLAIVVIKGLRRLREPRTAKAL